MPNITGGLKAILEAAKPLAVKTSSMVGGLGHALLKGNSATGADWYRQLANKPGVKPAALNKALGHMQDSPLQMTKEAFLNQAKAPKLYTQKAYKANKVNDDMAIELARDAWADTGRQEELIRDHMSSTLGVGPDAEIIDSALNGSLSREHPAMQAYDEAFDEVVSNIDNDPMYQDLYDDVLNNMDDNFGKEANVYPEYQRQPESKTGGQYFETVLRQGPQEGLNLTRLRDDSYHFHNPAQIAHARGSFHLGENDLNKGNALIIDEIQSDPTEALRAQGKGKELGYQAIKNPHGDMAKALILQAAKGDADLVAFPSADKIADVRSHRVLPFYQNVYDDQLYNEVFKPLDAMGIKTEDTGDWRNVILDPDTRKALQEHGLPFKKGGAVVGHENEYVKKAGDFSRKSQQWAAGLVPGLQSVITDANQPYYPKDTEHNGPGDAMRHLLFQAGLTDKYGEVPAQVIGWLHEASSIGQPDAEYDMDAHNDGLGRQLGGLGLTKEELVRRARSLVDSGAAKTLPQGEDGYYKGGLVK